MPYRLRQLPGFKWDHRVGMLSAADVLVVQCGACWHIYRVAPHVLFARFPADFRLLDIGNTRMRCRKCGKRGKDVMTYHVEQAFPPVQGIHRIDTR